MFVLKTPGCLDLIALARCKELTKAPPGCMSHPLGNPNIQHPPAHRRLVGKREKLLSGAHRRKPKQVAQAEFGGSTFQGGSN